jgi:CRP-like cAMP-binding protein
MGNALDVHTLIDVVSVVLSVAGGYFAAMRSIDKRLQSLEQKVAILLDRDRRKRLADYDLEDAALNG